MAEGNKYLTINEMSPIILTYGDTGITQEILEEIEAIGTGISSRSIVVEDDRQFIPLKLHWDNAAVAYRGFGYVEDYFALNMLTQVVCYISGMALEWEKNLFSLNNVLAFRNPVGPWCPDPCFWKGDDGYFYVKGTGRLVTVKRTRDFTSFEDTGRVFISEATMDAIFALYGHYATDDANYKLHPQYWAPFVIKIGQRWVLYLAIVEREGTKAAPAETTAHIMALTSRTPYGDFGDPVTIVSDGDYKLTNSVIWNNIIDPFVYCNPDDQKLYLVAGSSYSIGRLELTDDGLATVLPKGVGNKCARMAGLTISSDPNRTRVYEGSYIYRHVHNGTPYYYLFVSAGDYSTRDYCVCVGRSTSLNSTAGTATGYKTTDYNGDDLVSQSHYRRVILSTESSASTFWGPGHIGGIFETEDGKTWMLYHCHDGNGTQDRKLFIQEVLWDESGWPYLENNGHPISNGFISKGIITETTRIEKNAVPIELEIELYDQETVMQITPSMNNLNDRNYVNSAIKRGMPRVIAHVYGNGVDYYTGNIYFGPPNAATMTVPLYINGVVYSYPLPG